MSETISEATCETTAQAAPDGRRRRAGRAKSPADLGPVQVLRHTGLPEWQWQAGMAAGLIPAGDAAGGRWSRAAADAIAARQDEIVAVVGDRAPVGANRAAEELAARTGLPVERADIEALAEAGLLAPVGQYKGWPVYGCRGLDAVDVDELGAIVAERQAWVAVSVSRWDAPAHLGWHHREFERVARQRGLQPGRLDRYATADLNALAGDEDLAEQVRLDRLLTAAQAAAHLEVRPTDFRYLVAAGLAVPQTYTVVQVSRYREVDVPLYRTGDLEELRAHPGIDWEATRAVRAGDPSPLRHLAHRPLDRAAVIRRGIAELGARLEVEVWAWWNNAAGVWEVDFERRDGGPGARDFAAAIAGHPALADHRADIRVATSAGAALRWARAMREPGAAVILDTETTGLAGYLVEVAVIDAATGATLLDTLVRPGCPVEPGARAVHGITDAELDGAPLLSDVLPRLLRVTKDRTVIAYNAEFDAGILARHAGRDGLDLAHLADPARWSCLMSRRSDWQMRRRWLPLGGGHRARGDCLAAYDLLCAMTAPARQPKTVR